MSTKTTFKRIALVAVAALGLGVLSVAPSQAAVFGETLTIDAATDTATVGDTATAVLTHIFSATVALDSTTITSTCSKPTAAASCPTLQFWQTQTSDTSGIVANISAPTYTNTTWADTASATTSTARSVTNVKAPGFATVGTYTYTFYTALAGGPTISAVVPFTWTITVSAAAGTSAASARLFISADNTTGNNGRFAFGAGSDSAVVATKGTAATPLAVASVYAIVANSAGDTRVATATATKNTSAATAVQDTLVVTVSGPGLISSGSSTSRSKASTIYATNNGTAQGNGTNFTGADSITVWSDGTAGTGTITVSSSAGVVFTSFTVTFTGTPASAAIALSDTIVSLTAGSTIVGTVKDSGGNVMTSGTVYVYSSDTKVAGTNLSTNAYPTTATGYTIPSTGVLAYTLTTTDTGVATITLRDSWTVAASTWTSNEVVVTVTGSTVATLTVAFDKATYAPGERAVITYTAKDIAGKALATAAVTGLTALSNATMTDVTIASITGTNSGAGNFTVLGTSFQGFMDTGVETRVVTMPTYAGAVNLTNTFATFGSTTGAKTTVTATATVVDPNAAGIAAAKDASDAATDAALEATDAAYAATDAANIAAEAADAATAAAEAATEAANAAKEAADAATAAVEELATSVAKLMAALQAQITTLAKVVAKIAVKVKA